MYKISGYNEMCEDFTFYVDSFMKAVFFERTHPMYVVFCECAGRLVRLR